MARSKFVRLEARLIIAGDVVTDLAKTVTHQPQDMVIARVTGDEVKMRFYAHPVGFPADLAWHEVMRDQPLTVRAS